jgi:hypothetical protein
MSKHNLPIPAAFEHGNRPNDSVVQSRKWKRPNALKHGVFAIYPIMSGEDPREFEALLSAVTDEWQPSGPTEADKVFAIAHAIWCKFRAQRHLRGKLLANTFDPRHPDFDELRGLFLFSDRMRSEPETAFANYASRYLRRDKIDHLKEKFPRSNYPSTEEWAEAVITEIETQLMPAIMSLKPEPGAEIDALSDLARKVALDMRLTLSYAHSKEFFEHELDQLERLDARIGRLVKDLVQMSKCFAKPRWSERTYSREKSLHRAIPKIVLGLSISKKIRVDTTPNGTGLSAVPASKAPNY